MARELGDVLHYFLGDAARPGEASAPSAPPSPRHPAKRAPSGPEPLAARPPRRAGHRGPVPRFPVRGLAGDLADRLRRLQPPLELIADGVLGMQGRMGVGRDPTGRAVVVIQADSAVDARGALTEGLAQAAWLAPRVTDWCKLAPALGLRPEAGVGVLLLAPDFDLVTRAAAASVPGRIRLASATA